MCLYFKKNHDKWVSVSGRWLSKMGRGFEVQVQPITTKSECPWGWANLSSLLSSSKWVDFIVAMTCLNPAQKYEYGTFFHPLDFIGKAQLFENVIVLCVPEKAGPDKWSAL